MAINVNVDGVNVKSAKILKNLRTVQGLTQLASRKSIMTMASPGLYQYPLIGSASIDPSVYMSLMKTYQLTLASSVAISYSLNGSMDRSEYGQISDYVKKFHQNDPSLLGANLTGLKTSMGVESLQEIPEGSEVSVESAVVANDQFSANDFLVMNLAAWDDTKSSLVLESLNDVYKPYIRTQKVLRDRISMAKAQKEKAAMEGVWDALGGINDEVNGPEGSKNASGITPKTENLGKDKNGKTKRGKGQAVIPNFKNEVVKNDKLTAMEPTMVNVQIIAHGGKSAGGKSQSVHNITLGVKVMPRIIDSDLMIASMIEACQESNAIFKFIKWTKGEVKTLDALFGVSKSKARALQKGAKEQIKFLEQSKKRKTGNLVGKFTHNEALPTTNVVITSYEAERIKDATGVDLTDIKNAIKLMNKYFLLSFGIYDTERDILQVMFDCDTDWGHVSLSTMKAEILKITDVMDRNGINRLTGRTGF